MLVNKEVLAFSDSLLPLSPPAQTAVSQTIQFNLRRPIQGSNKQAPEAGGCVTGDRVARGARGNTGDIWETGETGEKGDTGDKPKMGEISNS